MVESLLSLGPTWCSVKDGDEFSLLVGMIIFVSCYGRLLVRTAVPQKFVTIGGPLRLHAFVLLIVGARLFSTDKGFRLSLVDTSKCLPLFHLDCGTRFGALETCAGAGFMKKGSNKDGFQVFASNDLRQSMMDFQLRLGFSSIGTGNIGDDNMNREPFAGGFSRRTGTALGDQKGLTGCISQAFKSGSFQRFEDNEVHAPLQVRLDDLPGGHCDDTSSWVQQYEYDFLVSLRNFLVGLNPFVAHYGFPFRVQLRRPRGEFFQCWANSICILVSRKRVLSFDVQLRSLGFGLIKRVQKPCTVINVWPLGA